MATIIPPNTVSQLSHAITINVGGGQTIGAINGWNPKLTRTVTELYELGDGSTAGFSPGVGVPMEKVPGNLSGMAIDIQRYDLYTQQMEQAFQSGVDLTMLSEQLSPIMDIRETWIFPSAQTARGYANQYTGCWFSDLGRTITSTGDRIINVNATLQYTRKARIPLQ